MDLVPAPFTAGNSPIVYLDESGFEAETIRSYSYAPIGTPYVDSFKWLF